MNGKITFVGAGPGAVDLITLRGAAALDDDEYRDLWIFIRGIAHEDTVVLDAFALLCGTGLTGDAPRAVDPDVDVLLVYDGKTGIKTVADKVNELIKSGKTVSAQKTVNEKLRYKEIVDLRRDSNA